MQQADRVTVTFLFSDIEGSTKLLERLGERWPATLEAHRRVVRAALEACGGTEHGTEGDSFFASFPSAAAGVGAAALIQRGLAETAWPEGAELRVRVGVHTGEAQRSGEG
ncbi:MAG TPA: adenylate/guanylate cyclase domain-containing protein, partial [Egibacteraceae bacterium]|nr:adenylate/guanylate cyclase domain-containing protein [Egibacteraceae bacterium]